jgi:hypothetical protein
VSNSDEVPAFVDAIANGAGSCDVDILNKPIVTGTTDASDGTSYISDVMPAHCTAYYAHAFVGAKMPVYVGTPEQGGRWAAEDGSSPLAKPDEFP